ncbi:zinc finger, CCHC-type containing protein [Tanacetum coccineum]
MASNFAKLDKFEGVDFRRWQKKMHFLLSSMSVVYVLTTPIPEDDMSDPLFDIYQNIKSREELCDSLEAKYMAEDASSKKSLVSCIIDKLPPSWKDFNHTLKHKKEELTLVELDRHLRIKVSLRAQDSDKPKGNNVVGAQLNIVNDIGNSAFMSTFKLNDSIIWHARLGYVHFKRMQDMSKDGLILAFDMDTKKCFDMTNRGGLSQGFWDEAMVVVRLPDPKLKTLGEKGIECIFVGYAEHSNVFRFHVIKSNDLVSINSIIESRDAIFDENRFSSIPRPSLRIPNGTEDIGGSVVLEEVVQQPEPELRKSKRNRTPNDFGPEFQLYLIKGTRDEVSNQHSHSFNVDDDPKTFDEVMKSQDVAFWKKAINDEMDSIMGNNTWVLADLPPGCKPLGCKWIFKRKLKMDVKTSFLNGDLEEEIYMNQPQGFIMPGNENKICKLIKSLYGLKQAPKQWHQKFDEVVLSNGYLLNQVDKCVYSKFDEPGKGVIICLYVDDMLIFGTDQVKVNLTKEFLSSKFFMKDMGEADVILGIRIKHGSNGIAISQSHYIEKVLKKFNYFDCTSVSTPMDTSEKLMPNNSQVVSQLEYSRVIGCLMYAMTYIRPDIAFAMGKLSRLTYTRYPSVLEGYTDASWISNTDASWISNTEDNLSTSGWVFLLRGGAISWASKKQTCITGFRIKYEFVALAAAGKEAEWLKNLLLEILLWVKPIAPIFIRYDSAATLANACSQMYNGKSRHLGVGHSMIHELIMNGVIYIEFVRSQQNLADHLTKGLARYLVIKSAERDGIKIQLSR